MAAFDGGGRGGGGRRSPEIAVGFAAVVNMMSEGSRGVQYHAGIAQLVRGVDDYIVVVDVVISGNLASETRSTVGEHALRMNRLRLSLRGEILEEHVRGDGGGWQRMTMMPMEVRLVG